MRGPAQRNDVRLNAIDSRINGRGIKSIQKQSVWLAGGKAGGAGGLPWGTALGDRPLP